MRKVHESGFSLIELLMVLSIVMLLMGMLVSLMQYAKRAAGITATQAIMAKVDTGLRLFKADIGGFPYQKSYADLGAGEAWTNRLAYHLGRNMTTPEVDAVRSDMETAAAQYAYDFTSATDPDGPFAYNEPLILTAHNFRRSWIIQTPNIHHASFTSWNSDMYMVGLSAQLNQMGQERARLAIAVGHAKVCGVRIPLKSIDKSTSQLVSNTSLQSADTPGWATDYLRGEIESRYIDQDAIKDSFGRPLIYIGQIIPGVRGTTISILRNTLFPFNPSYYGLAPTGRIILSKADAGDGKPTPVDPLYFPDTSNLMRSDLRYYAAPKLDLDIELWSAGPDGQFTWFRDGFNPANGTTTRVNNDNISLIPYNKQLIGQ